MDHVWPKRLLLVLTNCTDPAREQEFNYWYSHTHLPDLAEAHGLVHAVRYHNLRPRPGGAEYLAIYEVDTDDIRALVKEVLAGDEERKRQGRMIDCVQVWFSGAFERVDP